MDEPADPELDAKEARTLCGVAKQFSRHTLAVQCGEKLGRWDPMLQPGAAQLNRPVELVGFSPAP